MRLTVLRLALGTSAAAVGLGAAAAHADPASPRDPAQGVPVGKLTFRGRGAAVGVGFAWGAATLEFQGKTYPVRVDGFVLAAIGTTSIEGVGDVYGLAKAEDLNGDFTAVSSGVALGRGTGKLVMRNDKGVRVVMDTTISGVQVGFGPRGLTLSVGEAGGEPADASARLPQTLGFGEIGVGPVFLKPTLNAQVFYSIGANAGFDGQWSFGPVEDADHWFEHSNEIGLNVRYPLGDEGAYGTLKGRVSGVYSLTQSAPDGPVCESSHRFNSQYTLESGYLAWKSGEPFASSLGVDAIEISGGNQNYQVFDGLLFWDGGQDCAGRGANWLSPRKAFRETGIVRIDLKNFTFEGLHLKSNDHPDTHTRLAGGRAEYVTDDSFLQYVKLGLMYFGIYESDVPTRNNMDGIYVYTEMNPLRVLPDLSYTASFVRENNSRSSGLTEAYGWYIAPAYQFSNLPWKPQISYRYAFFSGGSTRAFDSLFTGLPDWGTWFQGELLGEFVLSNSNLITHQLRLKVEPTDILTLNLIYYKFRVDDPDVSFGVDPARIDHSLADEVDLIADLALTNWWSLTGTMSVAVPNRGFREAVNGDATWFNTYLFMSFSF